jgi:hypothetical protein
MSADNIKGLLLAVSSSLFIGASFIVKKKGLKKAGASGVRAGTLPRPPPPYSPSPSLPPLCFAPALASRFPSEQLYALSPAAAAASPRCWV